MKALVALVCGPLPGDAVKLPRRTSCEGHGLRAVQRARAALALSVAVAGMAEHARAADVPLFHEVGLAVAVPTGVTVAASYAPTLSLLEDRLHLGAGPRLTAYFDGGAIGYPNGNADLIAAGAHNTLTFNLFLFGRHDQGQLDSELFAAYWLNPWGLRAGVSHMSTEYTTDRALDARNDRFRASATRFLLAVGRRFR